MDQYTCLECGRRFAAPAIPPPFTGTPHHAPSVLTCPACARAAAQPHRPDPAFPSTATPAPPHPNAFQEPLDHPAAHPSPDTFSP